MPLVMNLVLQKQPYVYAVCTVIETLTVVCRSWRWNDPCHQEILTTNWFRHQCYVPKWPHSLCKLIQNLYCVCVFVQENNFGVKISLQNKWHGKISCSQYENVRGETITWKKHIRCNISILHLHELQMDLKKPNFFKGTISYMENTVFALI